MSEQHLWQINVLLCWTRLSASSTLASLWVSFAGQKGCKDFICNKIYFFYFNLSLHWNHLNGMEAKNQNHMLCSSSEDFRKYFARVYAQECSQVKFNAKLAVDKGQQN